MKFSVVLLALKRREIFVGSLFEYVAPLHRSGMSLVNSINIYANSKPLI